MDEAGRLTPKYFALRDAIRRHLAIGEVLPEPPAAVPTIAIPRFALGESVNLFDALPVLSKPIHAQLPKTMEALGQNYGFVLYRTHLDAGGHGKLMIDGVARSQTSGERLT